MANPLKDAARRQVRRSESLGYVMKLWEYTGEELIGGAEIMSDMILGPEIEIPWESDRIEGIISMPNYATAPARGHKGLADQVLLERDGDSWRCVGYYVDNTIIVFRRAQNTGIADILFLRCMEHRNKLPITTALNESALRLFKRVHKREVEKAKRDGCNVPERVLEEFPDLKDGN